MSDVEAARNAERRSIEIVRTQAQAKDEAGKTMRITLATVAALAEPRVMIGIHLDDPDPALCRHLEIEAGTATLVRHVVDGLPAAKAGMQLYDVIVAVNDETTAAPARLREIFAESEPGQPLELSVIRAARPLKLTIIPEAFDRTRLQADSERYRLQLDRPGIFGQALVEEMVGSGRTGARGFFGGEGGTVYFDEGLRTFLLPSEHPTAMRWSPAQGQEMQERLEAEITRLEQKLEESFETIMTKVLAQVEVLLDRIQRDLKENPTP